MPAATPITVRLSDAERQALDELAVRTNLRRSDLLRLGLAAVVTDVGAVVRFVQAGHERREGEAASSPPPPPRPNRAARRRKR